MITQNTNQAIQSVSNDHFSYVHISSSPANDMEHSRQYTAETLLETMKATKTSVQDLSQNHDLHLAEIAMALRGGRNLAQSDYRRA